MSEGLHFILNKVSQVMPSWTSEEAGRPHFKELRQELHANPQGWKFFLGLTTLFPVVKPSRLILQNTLIRVGLGIGATVTVVTYEVSGEIGALAQLLEGLPAMGHPSPSRPLRVRVLSQEFGQSPSEEPKSRSEPGQRLRAVVPLGGRAGIGERGPGARSPAVTAAGGAQGGAGPGRGLLVAMVTRKHPAKAAAWAAAAAVRAPSGLRPRW